MQPLILLVDDHVDALDMYRDHLTSLGYRVAATSSGDEAIDIARATHPDVIFMDLQMPRLTGTAAMHLLRSDPAFISVPIVALTALAFTKEQQHVFTTGFDEVIIKPFLPDELAATVERLLARNAPARERLG